MSVRVLLSAFALASCLAGCAGKIPKPETSLASSFVSTPKDADVGTGDAVVMEPSAWLGGSAGLAGRSLTVSSLHDLNLRHKEVVLTFDDGPVPGKTERILDILDTYRVKATFLMVGQMANSYPSIARAVAARGHSIGSHTFRHANLRTLSFDMAMNEVMRGEKAVEKAIGEPASFFRFPYLADSPRLRKTLAARGDVVLDVDVDSKDYFKTSPVAVTARTMAALGKRGRGIILLHDIHNRTVAMLPSLLTQLKAGGYKVVALRYKRSRIPELLMASATN